LEGGSNRDLDYKINDSEKGGESGKRDARFLEKQRGKHLLEKKVEERKIG